MVEEIGNKHIEKRNKIRQEEQKREKEEVRIVDEFATRIKPILEAAGWNGEWRVFKEFLHYVLELQLSGKKRMRTEDFLRGFRLEDYRLVW